MLEVNRQRYYQHRRPTAHQERDQQLRRAIQRLREAFAGYGYRRVTKALMGSGKLSKDILEQWMSSSSSFGFLDNFRTTPG